MAYSVSWGSVNLAYRKQSVDAESGYLKVLDQTYWFLLIVATLVLASFLSIYLSILNQQLSTESVGRSLALTLGACFEFSFLVFP